MFPQHTSIALCSIDTQSHAFNDNMQKSVLWLTLARVMTEPMADIHLLAQESAPDLSGPGWYSLPPSMMFLVQLLLGGTQ